MSRRCCLCFGLQLGVELDESAGAVLYYLFIQENFYFSPESLIEAAAETDPYARINDAHQRYVQVYAIPMIGALKS